MVVIHDDEEGPGIFFQAEAIQEVGSGTQVNTANEVQGRRGIHLCLHPFRDVICFPGPVVNVGNAHVDLLSCVRQAQATAC